MNQYITGAMIKRLREEKHLTQSQLAEKLAVSDKAISKWETGRGYPDISLVEALAKVLGVSIIELMSGEDVANTNRAFDMRRVNFYVCPVCGNAIFSVGEAVISCHGIVLPALEAEDPDGQHPLNIETVEDEYYITSPHSMSKEHHISFFAAVKDNGCEIVKLYPESCAEARFKISRTRDLYYYCNKHGLFRRRVRPARPSGDRTRNTGY
ncbi:MAG: helix-turn-helix domain-containing protein [Clostridia bacterium]|nr:helix-turn-helix domain-containing protein [Clostridia bacterium]